MSRSERLIGLMQLREKMRARRQAQAVGELSGELGRAQSMQTKLIVRPIRRSRFDRPDVEHEGMGAS